MTTENQNPQPVVVTQPASPVICAPITLELYRFLNEAAKLTVFAIFVLYAIGFLIWHSYLENYGVSSMEFLQVEYLSAAVCYLFVIAGFAIPPALLIERLFLRLEKKENPESEKVSFLIFFLVSVLCKVDWCFLSRPASLTNPQSLHD
jgi:nitrate reductase gamma subunit